MIQQADDNGRTTKIGRGYTLSPDGLHVTGRADA